MPRNTPQPVQPDEPEEIEFASIMPAGLPGDTFWFEEEDFALPRIKIVQPTSTMSGATQMIGQFYNNVLDLAAPSLYFVLVGNSKVRRAYPRKYQPDQEALCGSGDYFQPDSEYLGRVIEGHQIGVECERCPLAHHTVDPSTGEKLPALCAPVWMYYGIDVESGLPFKFEASRSSMGSAKVLNTLVRHFGTDKIYQATTVRKEGRNAYYTPVFRCTHQPASDEILQLLAERRQVLLAMTSRPSDDGHDEPFDGQEPGSAESADYDNGTFGNFGPQQ